METDILQCIVNALYCKSVFLQYEQPQIKVSFALEFSCGSDCPTILSGQSKCPQLRGLDETVQNPLTSQRTDITGRDMLDRCFNIVAYSQEFTQDIYSFKIITLSEIPFNLVLIFHTLQYNTAECRK